VDFDILDMNILQHLQRDCSVSIDKLGERVGLSRNAVWRRIKGLEESGLITNRVALVDPQKLGLDLLVFIQIRTSEHDERWRMQLSQVVQTLPQVLSAHRMTGDLDYLVMARVANMAEYDKLYQLLTAQVSMRDVSASFVMESLKNTTELPVLNS
jgi:Lrp/AsnC family transcriptional regulator